MRPDYIFNDAFRREMKEMPFNDLRYENNQRRHAMYNYPEYATKDTRENEYQDDFMSEMINHNRVFNSQPPMPSKNLSRIDVTSRQKSEAKEIPENANILSTINFPEVDEIGQID